MRYAVLRTQHNQQTGKLVANIEDTSSPLVSVVMATYRNDSLLFLEEAVDSVLNQTHAHLELIVVLDGPVNSDTSHYLDTLAATEPRLRVLALPENKGPATARNAGIAQADGEYIAILDADDLAKPERIEKQLQFLVDNGYDVVGSCYDLLDSQGAVTRTKSVPTTPGEIRRWLCWFNPIGNSTVLAKAELLKQHPYSEAVHSNTVSFDGEDYALWVTLIKEGHILANQPESLVQFREADNFIAKRKGWIPFRTDLETKLSTLSLYPLYKRPLVVAASVSTAAVRLMPSPILAVLYALRNAFQFSGAK